MSAIIPTPFRPFLDNEIKLVDQLVTLNKPCTPSDWERIAEEYNYLLNGTANHGVKRDVQTLQTVWKCLPHDGRFKEHTRRRRTGRAAPGVKYNVLNCLREYFKEPPAGNSNPPPNNDDTLREVKTETNGFPKIEDTVLLPQDRANPQESLRIKREREVESPGEKLKLELNSLDTVALATS